MRLSLVLHRPLGHSAVTRAGAGDESFGLAPSAGPTSGPGCFLVSPLYLPATTGRGGENEKVERPGVGSGNSLKRHWCGEDLGGGSRPGNGAAPTSGNQTIRRIGRAEPGGTRSGAIVRDRALRRVRTTDLWSDLYAQRAGTESWLAVPRRRMDDHDPLGCRATVREDGDQFRAPPPGGQIDLGADSR